MIHLRGLSQTLVSLQVSHSSRTRACDLKVNLQASPHSSRQLHANNTAPLGEKEMEENRRDGLTPVHYMPEGSLLQHTLMQVVPQISEAMAHAEYISQAECRGAFRSCSL